MSRLDQRAADAQARTKTKSGTEATAAPTVHATAVAIGDAAVLLRGPPGSGKSDLALRCITLGQLPDAFASQSPWPDASQPVALVGDDYLMAEPQHGDPPWLKVAPPPPIAGLLEVRGIGLVSIDYRRSAVARLVVDLDKDAPDRMPQRPFDTVEIGGIPVPVTRLCSFEESAAVKVLLLLNSVMAAIDA